MKVQKRCYKCGKQFGFYNESLFMLLSDVNTANKKRKTFYLCPECKEAFETYMKEIDKVQLSYLTTSVPADQFIAESVDVERVTEIIQRVKARYDEILNQEENRADMKYLKHVLEDTAYRDQKMDFVVNPFWPLLKFYPENYCKEKGNVMVAGVILCENCKYRDTCERKVSVQCGKTDDGQPIWKEKELDFCSMGEGVEDGQLLKIGDKVVFAGDKEKKIYTIAKEPFIWKGLYVVTLWEQLTRPVKVSSLRKVETECSGKS